MSLADLLRDFRLALRSLRRQPGFTTLVVLTLALGIGANAVVFSLVDATLLRTLPVREPDRVVVYSDGLEDGYTDGPLGAGRMRAFSYPLFDRLRQEAPAAVVGGVAAYQTNRTRSVVRRVGTADFDTSPDPGVPAAGRLVSGNFFQVLGVSAWRGRTLLPDDERTRGGDGVVVLGHAYWQRRFGGAADVLGSALSINGHHYSVVGILAPEFPGARVGDPTDLWLPLSMQAQFMRSDPLYDRPDRWLLVYGRLQPGANATTATAAANVTLQRWLAERPVPGDEQLRRAIHIQLEPGATGGSAVRRDARTPLLVLWAGVALLLLIVLLNVSHLMLARAATRERELAIRSALGGSRARLLRSALAESCLLAAMGGAGGVLAANLIADGLVAIAPGIVPEIVLDARTLSLVVALAAGTAALLGLVPALHAWRTNVQEALRASSQAVTGASAHRRFSRLLLASQVAFSLVLLVGAGLLSGSLAHLRQQDLGFDRQHVLHAQMMLRETGLSRDDALGLYDELIRRVRALPGVQGASMSLGTGSLLRAATWSGDLYFPDGRPSLDALNGTVTPGYFDTLGIHVVRGRAFTAADDTGAPHVAVVNESLARAVFGSAEAAVGQRVRTGSDKPPDIQIVGVVGDVRSLQVRRGPSRIIYRPVAQDRDYLWSLEVRAHGDPAPLADLVRRAVREAHPALSTPSVRTLSDHVDRSLAQERLLSLLSIAFGAMAVFLVCLGLFGVISQWVGQRTREIGVRMALGATAPGLRWLVLRQAFLLVAAGMLAGLPAALAAAQALKGLLYGVPPVHPPTIALALLILLAVATAAAYLPARRASRVDPMQALRAE
jgi:predicted permease